MSTAVLPRGRQTKIRVVVEQTYGVAPAAGWSELNTYTNDLVRARALESDDILGAGFANQVDARPAAPDVEDATAKISVAMDLLQLETWLGAALGPATITGAASPFTHAFASGSTPLPSLSIEREFVAGAQYDGAVGMVIKTLKLPFKPGKGFTMVDMDLVGQQVLAPYTATAAGVPVVRIPGQRVANYVGAISIGGVQVGQIIDGSLTLTNDITLDRYIGSSEYVAAAILEGQDVAVDMTARYNTDALRALGVVDPQFVPPVQAVTFTWAPQGSQFSLTAQLPQVRFEPVNAPVTNGKTITQTLKGRAEVGAETPMLTVVLVNSEAA
jgi:Phage tail tube protein